MNRVLLLLLVILIPACRRTEDGRAGLSAAKDGDAEKAAADRAAAEKVAAEKLAAEKAAAEEAARARRIDPAVISRRIATYLRKDELGLGYGPAGAESGGGTLRYYKYCEIDAAGADRAIRVVHAEVWRLIDERKWDVTGTRTFPRERAFQFELRAPVGDLDNAMTVSFLPVEGEWPETGKTRARFDYTLREKSGKK